VADVSTDDAEREIAHVIGQYTEVLDVLINNAGTIKKHRGINETTIEDLEKLFGVHCLGAFRCLRSTLPFLRQSERAVVINISSRWGSISRTVSGNGGGIYSYQIAKCAQNMLTACLDQDLRPEGIRVMAVHPGRLKTEVGAPDADTLPREAAEALADWIEQVNGQTFSGLFDLMAQEHIGW
jgi:NAD(P)-dependent dehydrogenase (short-subunit alcohol dehydrogenase family)